MDTRLQGRAMKQRLLAWATVHKTDLIILGVVLLVSGLVSAINITGYPERFEDEGTYVSQAWAITEHGSLTHYTYWYDHPPFGWIQLAGYFVLTNALHRYGSAITAGREFMLVLHLATIVLLYALARRLGIGRVASTIGVAAYGLSPLVVEFSRYVMLDNIALPWLIGAFVLAVSPRKSLQAAVGCAACMAAAVLSKETTFVLLPVLLYALWHNGDNRNRRYTLLAFGIVFSMLSGFYILYALLKNELIPGAGHVSLLGSLMWQLHGRSGSGSIFDPNSNTRGLVTYWLHIDYWLLTAGTFCIIPALIARRTRAIGLALLVGLLMLLRSGYLPYPYVVALLPFAAVCMAAAVDILIVKQLAGLKSRGQRFLQLNIAIPSIAYLVVGCLLFVAPNWQPKLHTLMTSDNDASSRQALGWIEHNISRDNRMIVESALWTDLEDHEYDQPAPVWLYKTETDPAVRKQIGGWQGINYVILDGPTIGGKDFAKTFPTVHEAIQHGQLVTTFGENNQKILIYKIDSPSTVATNS